MMDIFGLHSKKKPHKSTDLSIEGTLNEIQPVSFDQMHYLNLYLQKIISKRNHFCAKKCLVDTTTSLHSNFLVHQEKECIDMCIMKQIEVEKLITEQMLEMNVINKNSPIMNPSAKES